MSIVLILMQLQIPLFIVALIGSLGGQAWMRSGQFSKAKVAIAIGFGASSLLAALYLGSVILMLRVGRVDAIGVLMAGLWAFFAWRDYKLLKMFKGR
jgi:hypothetical protein